MMSSSEAAAFAADAPAGSRSATRVRLALGGRRIW
jgi:hypothetical protein